MVDWGQSRNRSAYPIAHSVRETERPTAMIVLGIILLVAGFVLAILGSVGRTVGGRRHYF